MKLIYGLILGFSLHAYAWDTIQGSPPNQEVIKRIQAYLPEDPVIVEAGAYDGTDTAELAGLLPAAKIFTFEPVPELFEKTTAKLGSFSNIHAYNFALSDVTGKSNMYLSEFMNNPGTVSASSSLLPPTGHLTYASFVRFDRIIEVATTTLDDWANEAGITRVDLLKLDIQGNELDVMMASPKIFSSVKAVLTEVEFAEAYKDQYLFEDIKAWLEGQGFELDCLFVDCHWFGDALFIRK
jgi:FkbM family methyltransferase